MLIDKVCMEALTHSLNFGGLWDMDCVHPPEVSREFSIDNNNPSEKKQKET